MNSTNRILALVAICLVIALAVFAWPKHQGPAERAGEAIDNAAQSAKDAVDPPGPMEKAGRAVDEAVKK